MMLTDEGDCKRSLAPSGIESPLPVDIPESVYGACADIQSDA